MENKNKPINLLTQMKKPAELFVLSFLLIILSVNGLAGGVLMMLQPDGALLGMDPAWLIRTPFSNYLLPGLLLFALNGLLPALALVGLWSGMRSRFVRRLNIYPDRSWGWTFSLYSGITTLIWILVQQLITTYFVLQPIIASMAVLIMIFTLMPRTMSYFHLTPYAGE
jgi:hypothetical protein